MDTESRVGMRAYPPTTWTPERDALLGKRQDKALAREWGVPFWHVAARRKALGIGRHLVDRIGMRFGGWTILRELERQPNNILYGCRCECGRVGNVLLGNLVSGASSQCNVCKYKEQTKYKPGVAVGGSVVLRRTKERVLLQCACGKKRYVGVAAVGQKSPHCRKCRPATMADTYGRIYTVGNETHNLAGWARKLGITREAMRLRLLHGWSIEQASTMPKGSLPRPLGRRLGRPPANQGAASAAPPKAAP